MYQEPQLLIKIYKSEVILQIIVFSTKQNMFFLLLFYEKDGIVGFSSQRN